MTDQQIDAILALASKSMETVTENNKKWFFTAIILVVAFSATLAWISFWYLKTSYYPTVSTESQSQTESASSKSELNINKK